ncbi:hypothetical protein CJ010_00330 [Azoarcus sp. DD4]|uniref:hypothetical protein n=1 Tax=Azoarcus sp. DD4 TaxID=2027405 RepID=UPI001127DC36|nr:hypothetical protein [Azoarcus sp. DD4]QDF95107.1 hypothetical protein CJ010_00330 [Azoarcus sp. DD4]
MDASAFLPTKLVVSIAISTLVLIVLSRPLIDVLRQLCPDAPAAAFWLSYTRLMLTIAPLLLVLLSDMFDRLADPVASLRLTLLASLGGLLVGLYTVGKRLNRFLAVPHIHVVERAE